jgi:hypothetical protein
MKLNTLTAWPYIHACLFDLSCWCEMWIYGAPMRIHWGRVDPGCPSRSQPGGHVDIPVLSQLADWRSRKIWGNEVSDDFDAPEG